MRTGQVLSQPVALGLVFALAGFCYAVSTQHVESSAAGGRAVGTLVPLNFTNPLLGVGEYDLGDAFLGSQLTRYVTAEGGVKPYRFTSEGPNNFGTLIAGFDTTLAFGESGVLSGVAPASIPDNPLYKTFTNQTGFRFNVTLRDSLGTTTNTKSANYNLALIPYDSAVYRFAVSSLPTGLVGSPYIARVETLGAVGRETYSLVSVGGAATLAEIGLSFTTDGALIGRPLKAGTYTLTVRATDSLNRTALDRTNAAPDQSLTLTVNDTTLTTSDLITTSCSVRGDAKKFNSDSLTFKGLVNLRGTPRNSLVNADFFFQLDGITVSGRLDAQGRLKTQTVGGETATVKVDSEKGTVDVRISKGTFAAALQATDSTGAVTLATPTVRKPILLTVGSVLSTTETLDFESEVKGSRFALNYKLGSAGTSSAGAFQLLKVSGKDGLTNGGQQGTAWKASFIALPRTGVTAAAGLDKTTQVNVRVGLNFEQSVRGIVSTATKVSFNNTLGSGAKKFQLDIKKGKGRIDTYVLSANQTGIPTAGRSAGFTNLAFPLGIELVRSTGENFFGEHGRTIYANKDKYSERKPRR